MTIKSKAVIRYSGIILFFLHQITKSSQLALPKNTFPPSFLYFEILLFIDNSVSYPTFVLNDQSFKKGSDEALFVNLGISISIGIMGLFNYVEIFTNNSHLVKKRFFLTN